VGGSRSSFRMAAAPWLRSSSAASSRHISRDVGVPSLAALPSRPDGSWPLTARWRGAALAARRVAAPLPLGCDEVAASRGPRCCILSERGRMQSAALSTARTRRQLRGAGEAQHTAAGVSFEPRAAPVQRTLTVPQLGNEQMRRSLLGSAHLHSERSASWPAESCTRRSGRAHAAGADTDR
jgi:hypothetical protein